MAAALRAFDALTGDLLGFVVDLTADELQIAGEKPLTVPWLYRLRVTVPRWLLPPRRVDVLARSRWCRRERAGQYRSGLGVEAMPADARETVQRLLHDASQRESDAISEFGPGTASPGA